MTCTPQQPQLDPDHRRTTANHTRLAINMKFFIVFAFLALLAPPVNAWMHLNVREAGINGRFGPDLVNGTTFCPKLFADRGFSIQCIAPSTARSATFSVNGRFERQEMRPPYTIAGDSAGVIFPWNAYKPGKSFISCSTDSGERVTVKVDFDCGEGMPDEKKDASKKKTKTPVRKPKKSTKNPEVPPSSTTNSVEAARSASHSGGQCTTIPATGYVGSLAKGWENVNDGIFYKKDDPFEGVVPSSTARVTYKFTPPVTSKYALVLDMTTSHVTEHNGMLSHPTSTVILFALGAY